MSTPAATPAATMEWPAEAELAFAAHAVAMGLDVERGVANLNAARTARSGVRREHRTASAGTEVARHEVVKALYVTIKLTEAPAEESGAGAVLLLQRGVFDDVTRAMMVHPVLADSCAPRSPAITDMDVRYRSKSWRWLIAPHGMQRERLIDVRRPRRGFAAGGAL